MSPENRRKLLAIVNDWWVNGSIPEQELIARVVLIYKKGDSSDCNNYRPISLLNTMYKILAAALKHRIALGLDKHLQKTQFGFRSGTGTTGALHCIRK
eukprot:4843325-Karenia_brevis.AAC.1